MTDISKQIADNKKFPMIMGILNVTPDSFSDGGRFKTTKDAIDYALQMANDGADIIDIGGESTRPGAEEVSLNEELRRVIPVIEGIKNNNDNIKISIDTTKYEVAKKACELGINIINDISGLQFEPRLAELAQKYDKELIIMHTKGKPKTMQNSTAYNNIIEELKLYFNNQISLANSYGVKKIIIDTGVGFGKKLEHNLEILKNLEEFNNFGYPQMLGISRKSFFDHLLNIKVAEERDIPTALLHSLLLKNNLKMIRIHNVKLFSTLRTINSALT